MQVEESQPRRLRAPAPKLRPGYIVLVGLAVACVGLAVGLLVAVLQAPRVSVPDGIAHKLSFAPHLPGQLPGSYHISPTSFVLGDDDTVLAYQAKDKTGAVINITEQKRPGDFNFADFYSQQLTETQTVAGARYSAVWGKTSNDQTMLSIVTEQTWILMLGQAPLSRDDAYAVVSGL